MNHQQIDQFDLIDRYLMGKLLAEESASFEAHFVDCPQCIARLQLTKNFLEDLRGVAAAQSWPMAPARGFRPFLQSFLRWPLALAVACLLAAAIISAIIVIGHTRRLRDEAGLARQLAAQWERRYEDERQAALAAESKRREADSQQAEQRRALEARLADEAARRDQLEAEGSRAMTVGGNLIVAPLTSVRGSQPAANETINQVTVPRSASFFAITLTLDGEEAYKSYRGTIVDGSGRAIWSGSLTPDRHDALFAWFKPEGFQPGNYSLTVEGVKPGGGREVIGHYPFALKKTS